ncbi:MAG: hypothetical protein WB781_27055, partial [Candidatus Sulfotelmatobacter sp.]
HVLQTDAVFILRLKKEPLIDHARRNAIVATCCGVILAWLLRAAMLSLTTYSVGKSGMDFDEAVEWREEIALDRRRQQPKGRLWVISSPESSFEKER